MEATSDVFENYTEVATLYFHPSWEDDVPVDAQQVRPLLPGSSAEATLHVRLYHDNPGIQAIFHIHGLYSTVIGRAHAAKDAVRLKGWELQKALAGVTTHETTVEVLLFANDQDIAALSERASERLAAPPRKGRTRAPEVTAEDIAEALSCAVVQIIGNILVLFRPTPAEE